MSKLNQMLNKSRQFIELTKIGVKIEKVEKNIEQLYANLGRVFYKIHEQKAPEIMYADLFRTILGAKQQLEYLKNEAYTLSNQKKCQICNNDLPPDAMTCGLCE